MQKPANFESLSTEEKANWHVAMADAARAHRERAKIFDNEEVVRRQFFVELQHRDEAVKLQEVAWFGKEHSSPLARDPVPPH